MTDGPLLMQWTGEELQPASPWWVKRSNEQLVVGERYVVTIEHERSVASHAAYFAAINEVWQSLPDELAERFPTPDHLRKAALIKAGWRDERSIECRSYAEAQRVALFLRPMDQYAAIGVSGSTVSVLTAKSQSMKAMGKAAFQRSKDDVLRIIGELIGAPPSFG